MKKSLAKKVTDESDKILEIAEKAIKEDPRLKVIILKQPPRFDLYTKDPCRIKPGLSNFANAALDQCWYAKGEPKNIHIVDIKLGCENNEHLQTLIYGNRNSSCFDGVQMKGEGASRHYNYRLIQAIKPVLSTLSLSQSSYRQTERNIQTAQFAQNHGKRISQSSVVSHFQYQPNVPTYNRFSGLVGN